MYEKPLLSRVGKATDVIMGVISWGDDLDGLFLVQSLEYADDCDAEPRATGYVPMVLAANS